MPRLESRRYHTSDPSLIDYKTPVRDVEVSIASEALTVIDERIIESVAQMTHDVGSLWVAPCSRR